MKKEDKVMVTETLTELDKENRNGTITPKDSVDTSNIGDNIVVDEVTSNIDLADGGKDLTILRFEPLVNPDYYIGCFKFTKDTKWEIKPNNISHDGTSGYDDVGVGFEALMNRLMKSIDCKDVDSMKVDIENGIIILDYKDDE